MIRRPNEERNERRYPKRPIVGIGVVIWRKDKVLLVKRAKEPRQGEWGLPGGAQEKGETILKAAVREAREETGLDIRPLGIITAVDGLSFDARGAVLYHYTIVEVAAEALEGKGTAGDDVSEIRWANLDEVDRLCAWPEVARVVRLSLLQRAL